MTSRRHSEALELVLLGGFTGREVEGHDWEAILGTLGWLQYDRTLGAAAHGTGVVVMVVALLWGAAVVAWQAQQIHRKTHG